jgi:hypothetical protein
MDSTKHYKSLDAKIERIHSLTGASRDFILADAKDADMATGLASTGIDPRTRKPRTLEQYRQLICQNIEQGLVDIMLMSASTSELITIRERRFDDSPVTPACRANDTTDIHLPSGGAYGSQPSRPFRTALIDHIQAGKIDPSPTERQVGANLGLYSITPNNDIDLDYSTLLAFNEFRHEAERKGFRYFLEVFDPNACGDRCPADMGRFINDLIVRTLAGVASPARPLFLKVVYHGPAAMEQLASFDPHLIPGILGGSSGTTYDAFHQLWEARKYGARAALYGRMINNSEDQLSFIQHLRWLADGELNDPAEAVRSYHGALQRQGISPWRPLEDDLKKSDRSAAYQATGPSAEQRKPTESPVVQRHREKWNRILGGPLDGGGTR